MKAEPPDVPAVGIGKYFESANLDVSATFEPVNIKNEQTELLVKSELDVVKREHSTVDIEPLSSTAAVSQYGAKKAAHRVQ